MTLSSLAFTSRGAGPYPLAGLDFLSTAHLQAKVNGSPVSATFDAAANTCLLSAPAAADTTVTIERTTPRKREERLTQFLSLPSGQGGLTAALLDQDHRQLMLAEGEARDHVQSFTVPPGSMGLDDVTGQWDGESRKIQALTTGSDPADAVTKAQLDALGAGAILLPAVTGADNDDGLMVVSGAWAKKTPSTFRTALSLGSAALLTAGVAANNAPQLGSDAAYPAADGRNIDLTSHAIQTEIGKRALATVVSLMHLTAGISNNNVDPSASPTWSANAGTRVGLLSTPFTNRVELNNSGDVAFNASPQYFTLSAGTWRVRWVARVRGPAGLFDPWAFRITNDDDTTGQTVYYDSGVQNALKQPGGSNIYTIYADRVLLTPASSSRFVFRFAMPNVVGGGLQLRLFFHKVSTSLAS